MFRRLRHGALAGAAGTTALNAVTYLDMAITARSASDTPQQVVAQLAGRLGCRIPGDDAERDRRLQGLGPLAGTAAGVGVGVVAGLAWPVLRRLPASLGAMLLGGMAMAASAGPMAALGVSDPREWSTRDWVRDIVPHLVYGGISMRTLRRLEAGRRDDGDRC